MVKKRFIASTFRGIGKFFKWLFKGKSLTSHIAFLIVAYFSLKFLLFPAFLSIAGLNEVVAVLSGSMHHQPGVVENTFTGWLVFNGFNESEFADWPFIYGLDIGDAVTVTPSEISVGDVVVYYHENQMVIHRVVRINESNDVKYYTTKGDANPESLSFEAMIPESRIVGKAGSRVPWIGWPRTIMYYILGV